MVLVTAWRAFLVVTEMMNYFLSKDVEQNAECTEKNHQQVDFDSQDETECSGSNSHVECAKSTGPGNDLPAGSQNKVRLSASKDVEEDDLRDCAEKSLQSGCEIGSSSQADFETGLTGNVSESHDTPFDVTTAQMLQSLQSGCETGSSSQADFATGLTGNVSESHHTPLNVTTAQMLQSLQSGCEIGSSSQTDFATGLTGNVSESHDTPFDVTTAQMPQSLQSGCEIGPNSQADFATGLTGNVSESHDTPFDVTTAQKPQSLQSGCETDSSSQADFETGFTGNVSESHSIPSSAHAGGERIITEMNLNPLAREFFPSSQNIFPGQEVRSHEEAPMHESHEEPRVRARRRIRSQRPPMLIGVQPTRRLSSFGPRSPGRRCMRSFTSEPRVEPRPQENIDTPAMSELNPLAREFVPSSQNTFPPQEMRPDGMDGSHEEPRVRARRMRSRGPPMPNGVEPPPRLPSFCPCVPGMMIVTPNTFAPYGVPFVGQGTDWPGTVDS